MDEAKFEVGEVIRYSEGPTALMEVKNVRRAGGFLRYYGEQYFGGPVGAFEFDCSPATEAEIADWRRRWVCEVEGCIERVGLAGCRQCATHAREQEDREEVCRHEETREVRVEHRRPARERLVAEWCCGCGAIRLFDQWGNPGNWVFPRS